MIPGGGLAAALHIAPDELTGGLVVLSLFPAALFATWAASGRVGVRSLICRAFYWRVNPGWWLTVLFGLPVLTVGLALLMGDQLRPVAVPAFLASQLVLLLVNFRLMPWRALRGTSPLLSRPLMVTNSPAPTRASPAAAAATLAFLR